ncbi:MAG TPA: DinB family protein [Acidobacteriaceae bacterium]
MKIADALLLAFDAEIEMTRSYFEAFPEDKAGWKPHEKSGTLGEIAKHVALLPGFGTFFLENDFMEVKGPPPAAVFVSKADLFATLDAAVAKFRATLATASDDSLTQQWSFTKDGKAFSTAPRASMIKLLFLHHLIHHRAQLGVYLRLLNVPVPGIYGPSADAAWNPEKLGLA